MRHPAEGVLRRLLDEPSAVAASDRQHIERCGQCLAGLDLVRHDAELVHEALRSDAEDVDVTAAWQRLSQAAPATGTPVRARVRRPAVFLRRPAAAALAVAVVLGGAGTAAANDWLKIFESEQVVPVAMTTGDLVALPDLSSYGALSVIDEADVREVPSAAAAAEATGLDVPRVEDLPRGVSGEPEYQVGSRASATFTFSAEQAARAAAAAGEDLPAVPSGLDGASVRLDAGPGVAQVWTSGAGAPALIVGRAVAPVAYSSGVPFETVQDYLLSLPGLPDGVAEQLRSFTADGSTLPLPVPADYAEASPTDVDGAPATLLTARNGFLSAVVWVDEGVVTVVAGSLDEDEVLSVAKDLQ